MSTSLDKYRRQQTQPQDEEEQEELAPEDGKTYVAYRAASKLLRLMVCPKKEASRAPAYHQLMDVVWNPREGREVGLIFGHITVRIKGSDLHDLARQLVAHKVSFVQEFDSARWERPAKGEPVIDSIEYMTRLDPSGGGEGK